MSYTPDISDVPEYIRIDRHKPRTGGTTSNQKNNRPIVRVVDGIEVERFESAAEASDGREREQILKAISMGRTSYGSKWYYADVWDKMQSEKTCEI